MTTIEADTVDALISFAVDAPAFKTEKPYVCLLPLPSGVRPTNCEFSCQELPIRDIRKFLPVQEIEKHGFQYFKHSSAFKGNLHELEGLNPPPQKLVDYLEETRQFAKRFFKAKEAICFDWRLRQATPTDNPHGDDPDEVPYRRQRPLTPAWTPHADLTPASGWATVRIYLSAEELKSIKESGSRIRIINCWRSLIEPVEDVPLAVCVRGSITDQDWVPFDRVDGTAGSEGMFIKYSPSQQWYYMSKQRRNDLLLFESWDSEGQGYKGPAIHFSISSVVLTGAGHVAHGAFQHPKLAERSVTGYRSSIEVRIMVIEDGIPKAVR